MRFSNESDTYNKEVSIIQLSNESSSLFVYNSLTLFANKFRATIDISPSYYYYVALLEICISLKSVNVKITNQILQ